MIKIISIFESVGLFLVLACAPAGADNEGKALVEKNDCMTCHKIDAKLIGPSYKEVAQKYKGQVDAKPMLVEKIIKGGAGVWGQVPMTAHPALSEEDAEKMIRWVLSLAETL